MTQPRLLGGRYELDGVVGRGGMAEVYRARDIRLDPIVAVYDTGEDEAGPAHVPYIVMEYVDGRTLRELLRDDRRLLPERALEITDGVLRALDYSHRNGIVHRDIKPANVMLTRGRPPFTGRPPGPLAYQHVRENPIPPSRVDPEIPAWADSIVLKAMAKDPADRYQSAAEMRTDIQRALSGVPVAAPPQPTEMYSPGTRQMGPGTMMAG